MEKSKRRDYYEELKRKGYCLIEKMIPRSLMDTVYELLLELMDRYDFDDGNNPYVTNINRQGYSLYMGSAEVYRKSGAPEEYCAEVEERFGDVKRIIWGRLRSSIDSVFYLLRVRQWQLVGMTLFDCYKGCKEQEIHHDAPKGMNRIFITIPLHDTSKEMGPTIFYNEEKIKEYRHIYKAKSLPELPKGSFEDSLPDEAGFGSIGFYKDLSKENKIWEEGREQYKLELGDVTIHKELTFHSGGENKTDKPRRFLFIVCDIKI